MELDNASPPILSRVKVDTLFYRLPEILSCHAAFAWDLRRAVLRWHQVQITGVTLLQRTLM